MRGGDRRSGYFGQSCYEGGVTSEDLDRLYAVSVRGAFDLTKAFVPGMIERNYGVLINMSSVGGVVTVKDRLAYCTTRFAIVGFTKCIALEQGIRAYAIRPGSRDAVC
jgi:2-keto-3-deoxy-L-fuconate dehydrogenase